jgi:universal stress protein family protein
MDTGKQSGQAAPRSPELDGRPVVLVFVEDTIGSLAALLLAAEVAAGRQGHLHVVHICRPRMWWGGMAGIAAPTALLDEADREIADELREKVGDILALGPPVEWTFMWTRDAAHRIVKRLVSDLSPAAVVLGAPRRRVAVRPSLARWLIGRPGVQALVVPT